MRSFTTAVSTLAIVGASVVNIGCISYAYAQDRVLATIKPVHSLVAQVMGDTGAPDLLVSGSASPHSYIMKPSDAAKLASATIIFRMSATVEPFTLKAAETLAKAAELITLQDAPDVSKLPLRSGGPFEADDHDHDHAHDGDAHSEGHPDLDGHVWLDPANAKAMIDQIARTLSARNPARATAYAANAASAKARIDALSSDLTQQLRPVANRPYVVFHDAYQYFEKRFGLKVVGSITVNPEIPASGRRLAQLRERIKRLGAACVFGEPNFDAKVIRTVIEGTSAKSGVLDPEGAMLPAGPNLYDSLMRNLASDLVNCLGSRP